MTRFFYLLSILIFLAGCGSPPPVVEEIRPDSAQSSSAKPINLSDSDWSRWRGNDQTGISSNSTIPTEWSEEHNVLWKKNVPGSGHSSPVIVGDRLFLTSADEQQKTQFALCFDSSSGAQLWLTKINEGGFPQKHPRNSYASATPASDGHSLFVVFVNHQRLQVAAIDFDGNIIWETDAGEFQSEHGYGSSPTLFENLVIVNGDSKGGGFLAALDRSSGEIVWRIKRFANKGHGNYSSPVVASLAGKPQLIQTGYHKTISYEPATGEQIWWVEGPATVTGNTPVFSDPYVIVSGGYPEKATMSIKADGLGNVTETHVAWKTQRNIAYVPSAIIDEEEVIILTGDGIASSFYIETGKRAWQKRIGGNFSASPIRVGEDFYITNEQGKVIVFRSGKDFEILAENQLSSSGGMATPAIGGNSLYIRTSNSIYCIQNSRILSDAK